MKKSILLFTLFSGFSIVTHAQIQLVTAEEAKNKASAAVKECVQEQYELAQSISSTMKKVKEENLKLHQCKLQEGLSPFYDGVFGVLIDAYQNRKFDDPKYLNKAFVPFIKSENASRVWDFSSLATLSPQELYNMGLDFKKNHRTMLEIKNYYSKPERSKEKNHSLYPSQDVLSKISDCSTEFRNLVIAEQNLSALLKNER